MNLLSTFSVVAGKGFKDFTEVEEFFINLDFLEKFRSADVDFAINYELLTGKEARYSQAKKAFSMLKGLPSTFNNSGMGLSSKLVQFQKAFKPINMRVPKVPDITEGIIGNMFKESIQATGRKLAPISSYVNNKILTNLGKEAIEYYFANNQYAEIDLHGDDGNGGTFVMATTKLNKEEFEAFVVRNLVVSGNPNEEEEYKEYSNHQLKLLKAYVKSNLSEHDIVEVEGDIITKEELEFMADEFSGKRTFNFLGFDKTPSKEKSKRILHQLLIYIDKKDFKGINTMCGIIHKYRGYILHEVLFTKSKEALDKENAEHENNLLGFNYDV